MLNIGRQIAGPAKEGDVSPRHFFFCYLCLTTHYSHLYSKQSSLPLYSFPQAVLSPLLGIELKVLNSSALPLPLCLDISTISLYGCAFNVAWALRWPDLGAPANSVGSEKDWPSPSIYLPSGRRKEFVPLSLLQLPECPGDGAI